VTVAASVGGHRIDREHLPLTGPLPRYPATPLPRYPATPLPARSTSRVKADAGRWPSWSRPASGATHPR
jgi:hypothetical protein